jgi:hypothetical protein
MAVVAGIVFFVVRAILALIPGLADRAPIKKWAALAALIVTAFYLVLSGAEVATQRSFIMIAIVLIGVMLMLVAVIWAGLTPVPDILVGADGRTFAVRGADGRLAFHHTGGDTFATREWLAADADGRDVRDPSLGTASPATRPAASANSPMAGWSPTRSPPMLWRRTASAPSSS